MNENMEFPGATEADINWLQDCFVQCLKDKVMIVQSHYCSRLSLFKAITVQCLKGKITSVQTMSVLPFFKDVIFGQIVKVMLC